MGHARDARSGEVDADRSAPLGVDRIGRPPQPAAGQSVNTPRQRLPAGALQRSFTSAIPCRTRATRAMPVTERTTAVPPPEDELTGAADVAPAVAPDPDDELAPFEAALEPLPDPPPPGSVEAALPAP